ncbi:leucine-rich repeat domain-containing protein [Glaciecola sp. 1036]|uniref:leucine-rich repeat domain-containing protein n=1 Tax=Alteromonadaceae TaxID=72275 RepID=UPI003CFEF81E
MPKESINTLAKAALFFFLTYHSYVKGNIAIQDQALLACINEHAEQNLVPIERLEKLKCHGKDIESLKGIESLTKLEHLSLYSNQISQADLSALKALTYLNLANNRLKSLHIQGLNHLETLYLFKNNLTHLNVSGLIGLKKLRMTENRLQSLEMSDLVSLEEAYLWDNQLEDLDITALDKLTFLDVKQNPMPDELYDFFDEQSGITISHDGNADDWK